MDTLPISVIIAAKNAEKSIEECLSSVQMNNPAEIIVVDGNSTDKTLDIARRYTNKIYSDEGKGFNYAQQLGVAQATQEYVALVDADITLLEGTLATLLAELEVSNCISMQATILGANLSTYWERAADWTFRIFQAQRGVGLGSAVIRRATLLEHKFDPFLEGGGDYDFKIKVEGEGYKLGTSPSVVYHHHRADMKGFIKQRFRDGRVAARVIWKHGLWAGRFGPPVTRLYWICICLAKGKPGFIPYFIVDGIVETAGMMKGFFELIGESLGRKRHV